jgi:hypothetical protein
MAYTTFERGKLACVALVVIVTLVSPVDIRIVGNGATLNANGGVVSVKVPEAESVVAGCVCPN